AARVEEDGFDALALDALTFVRRVAEEAFVAFGGDVGVADGDAEVLDLGHRRAVSGGRSKESLENYGRAAAGADEPTSRRTYEPTNLRADEAFHLPLFSLSSAHRPPLSSSCPPALRCTFP